MPKVTIGDTEVFLPADRLPEFSYSLFDLTDPSKVRGARSTTFEIPATNAARQELGGVTLAEASPGPLPLRIGDGGVTIFGGTAVPTEWGDDVITVNAFGDNAGWFSAAKGTRIQDLDLGVSETINAAYQIASWTDEEQADVYPLIDYGGFADRTASFNVGRHAAQALEKAVPAQHGAHPDVRPVPRGQQRHADWFGRVIDAGVVHAGLSAIATPAVQRPTGAATYTCHRDGPRRQRLRHHLHGTAQPADARGDRRRHHVHLRALPVRQR